MALTQLPPIAIPPSGGLTEEQGKYLPSGFHQIDNCVFSKFGQVEKRHGYGALGGNETFSDGVKHVDVRGNELVMVFPAGGTSSVADPGHYLYSWASGPGAWIARCPVPRLAVRRYPAVRSGADLSVTLPQVARIGTVEAYLYNADGDQYLRVVDTDSGTVILADSKLLSGVARARLFVESGLFVFVWITGAGSLRFGTYDPANFTVGSTRTVAALGGTAIHWDAVPTAAGFFAVAAVVGADIQVKRVTTATGATSAFTSEFGRGGLLVGLGYLPGYAFLSMVFHDNAGDLRCKKYTETTLVTAVADWEVEAAATLGTTPRSCAVVVEPATFRTFVAWTREDVAITGDAEGLTRLRGFTAAGVSLGPAVSMYYTALQCAGFVLDGACYVAVADYYATVNPSVQRLFGIALVCLSRHPDQWDGSRPPAMEGLLAPLDGRGLDAGGAGGMLPLVPLADSDAKALLPIMVLKDRAASDGAGSWGDVVELDSTIPGAGLWRSTEATGLLHQTSAISTQYDGQCTSEIGFVQPPQIINESLLFGPSGVEGAAVGTVDYVYYAIWEWRDAAGNLHRSRRSAPYTVSIGTSGGFTHAAVTLTITTTGLTRRTDLWTGDLRSIRLKVYRTTPTDASDDNHYQVAYNGDVNVSSLPWVQIVDSEPDLTLIAAARGQLYTDGGAVDNDTPPPSRHLCVHGGRVWLVSAEKREIWFSKYIVQGEAPAFSALLRITLDDSPDDPVACEALGASLAIFTGSRIYLLPVNPGPGDTGAPAYPAPDAVQTSWGCVDARSVISYRDGVAFQSKDGLRLLTLGGDVLPLGDSAQDHLADYPTILGSVLDEERMRVLWLCANGAGRTIVLCWDYRHQAWTSWSWSDDLALTARAHCLWQGRHVLAAESPTLYGVWCESYGDNPGFDPGPTLPTWVTATIETPWIHLGAVGGYQRLWWVHLQLEKNSAYGLELRFFVDGDDSLAVQTETWTVSQMNSLITAPRQPLLVGVKEQVCSTVKLRITDTEPAVAVTENPTGFSYHELALLAGGKPGLNKLPKGNTRLPMAMLAIPAAIALAGAAASYYGSKKKVDKPYQAQALHQNAGAYEYGGSPDALRDWRSSLAKRDAGALGAADRQMGQADAARAQQLDLLGGYQEMAAGRGPNLAAQQARGMLGAAQAQQTAAAANVRGGAANQLVAQRGSAALGATMQGQVNQQISEQTARQQLAATDAQRGVLGDIRGGDFTARGMSEQRAAGALGARMGVDQTQLGASIQRDQDSRAAEQWFEEAKMGARDRLTAQQQADKDRWMKLGGNMMEAGGKVYGATAGAGGGKLCPPGASSAGTATAWPSTTARAAASTCPRWSRPSAPPRRASGLRGATRRPSTCARVAPASTSRPPSTRGWRPPSRPAAGPCPPMPWPTTARAVAPATGASRR